MQIVGVCKNCAKVGKADEAGLQPERVLAQHRLIKCLTGRPKEEDDREHDLRREQKIRQDFVGKDDRLQSDPLLCVRR
ncbi:hypothetical protein D3C87_1689310 [compost metagenome]